MDTGSTGTQHTSLNVDAVAEFRVITNSESAEFGRSVGAAINDSRWPKKNWTHQARRRRDAINLPP